MKIVKKIFLMLFVFFVGILTVNAESKNIKVTSVTVKEKSSTIEVAEPVISNNEITSNITFNQLNDYVTFELTLKNNESEKYKITSITDNNTNENLEVEYDYPEDFISSNDEAKVKVKLTYKNKLTNENISLDNLTITFNVENASGETSQIVLNPNTGDNILHFLVLLIIAITGLILIVRKKKIKIGALVLAIGLIIIPFAVLAEEKFEINFKFSNIEVKGEFESYNVTIDKGDGTEPTVLSVTYGEKIGELPDASAKEGHTFVGWKDEQNREITEDTVITGPMNITPVYRKDKHQLTITNPEYIAEENISGQYEYGTQITLTAIERDGFTFSKWSDNSTDNPRTITIGTTDITIEPIYTEDTPTEPTEATFKNGEIFQHQIIRLSGAPIPSIGNENTTIHHFTKTSSLPDISSFTDDNIVSTEDSDAPIYAWWDSTSSTIYWYSDADVIYLNSIAGYMFAHLSKIENIDLTNVDTSKTTSMGGMFYKCSSLEELDLSNFNTSNVTSMGGMFNNCESLKELDLSNFDTAKTWNMESMFSGNYALETLDISNFDTKNVTNLGFMFNGCTSLKTLDVSSFDTRRVTNMIGLFSNMDEIRTIFVSDKFVVTALEENKDNLFAVGSYRNRYLTGSRGSKLNGNSQKSYAHIDEGICNPGLFTDKYEAIIYFNPNGGSIAVESKYYSTNTTYTTLPTPLRKGYIFTGWFTEANGGDEVTKDNNPINGITLYAHWEQAYEDVLNYSDNGDENISVGDLVTLGNDKFYVVSNKNGVVKLLAQYNLDSNYRQSEDNADYIEYSDFYYWKDAMTTSTSSDSPLDISYFFNVDSYGYAYVYRNISGEDTNNNAKNYINNYKKHLVDDIGVEGLIDARLMSYEEAKLLTCESNTKVCKPFAKDEKGYWLGSIDNETATWFVKDSISTITYQRTEMGVRPLIEIRAEQFLPRYNVTFDTQGGTNIPPQRILEGKRVTMPADPTKDNYVFKEWYTDETYTKEFHYYDTITKDTTIYAKMSPLQRKGNIYFADMDDNDMVSFWDYVKIGDDEFWVLETPKDNTIKLLSKYNLNSNYRQEKSDDYVKVAFSNNRYWWDYDYNRVKNEFSPKPGTISAYVYTKDNKNNIYSYINNYGEYISSLNLVNVVDARAASHDEITSGACSKTGNGDCKRFISNQHYWLGTNGGTSVYGIMGKSYISGAGSNMTFLYGNSALVGVRPLIEIPENAIEVSKYLIKYDYQYNSIEESKSINAGSAIGNLPDEPTRDNYTFKGWYTDKNYTTQVTPERIPTGCEIYYAKWEANITYNDLDNNGKINTGDYVRIGKDEFYVIDVTNQEKVKLISKYNITSDLKQTNSDTAMIRLRFSDDFYWWDNYNKKVLSVYSKDSLEKYYVYRTNTGIDAYTNIKFYIQKYKAYLSVAATYIEDARIPSYEEVAITGCDTNDSSCPTYMRNQKYWTGSEHNSSPYIWYVSNESKKLENIRYDGGSSSIGIRPLIIVPKTVLSN